MDYTKNEKKLLKERVIKKNMESRKMEILMEEILKVVKRTYNKLEKIEEKNKQIRK